MDKVFIIAEAGVNHNGNITTAKELIDVACMSGADAVKFQTFKAHELVSEVAAKAPYQQITTEKDENQLTMIKKLELSVDGHVELIQYCRQKKIMFLSSAFDFDSIDLLNELGLETFKIPSGEITNVPYLKKMGSLKKRIILSTGMANLEEIKEALDILTKSGTTKENITILHCNTQYPTPFEDVNLKAMLTIRDACNVGVGYSDHTPGIEIPVAAVALGAKVIEKHFTLDKDMEGPDHKASLEPEELTAMVRAIRRIEKALGDGIKKPSPSEVEHIDIVRKSLVARKEILQGQTITEEDIAIKRPGYGVPPKEMDKVIGRKAGCHIPKDRVIEWTQIK